MRAGGPAVEQLERIERLLDDACLHHTGNPATLSDSLDRVQQMIAALALVTPRGVAPAALAAAGRRAQESHERLVQAIAGEIERLRGEIARLSAGSEATARYADGGRARRLVDRSA